MSSGADTLTGTLTLLSANGMALCKPWAEAQSLPAHVELKDGVIITPILVRPGTHQHTQCPCDCPHCIEGCWDGAAKGLLAGVLLTPQGACHIAAAPGLEARSQPGKPC